MHLPRPSPPPFDIEQPWRAIKEWIPDDEPNLTWFNQPRQPQAHEFEDVDQSPTWQPKEVALEDGRVLVLDGQ